jgi:hypothetical protein
MSIRLMVAISALCMYVSSFSAVYSVSTSREFLDRLAAVNPGDTILVQPGEYVDNTETSSHAAFNPAQSGRPEAPIVIQSARRHQAIVRGSNDYRPAIGIHRRDHIIVDGFRVVGAIGFRENADHGVLRNCDITRGYIQGADVSLHWGAYIQTSQYCLVENNYVHDMAPIGNRRHNGACIMIFRAQHTVVQNNTADGGYYMFSAFGQKAGIVHDNVWRRNIAKNAKVGFLGMGSTDWSEFSERNAYYENIALNTGSFISLDHNCRNFQVYNNTAHNVPIFFYGGYRAADKQNTGMEVWNNIACADLFRQNHSSPSDWAGLAAYSDGNNIPRAPASWQEGAQRMSLEAWRERTGFDQNSLSTDPLFINPATDDYRLGEQSPLIHAGVIRGALSPGYDGMAPDIGAYPRGDSTLIGHDWSYDTIGNAHPVLGRGAFDQPVSAVSAGPHAPRPAHECTARFVDNSRYLALTAPSAHVYQTARLFDLRGKTIAQWDLTEFRSSGRYRLPLDNGALPGACGGYVCEVSGAGTRVAIPVAVKR